MALPVQATPTFNLTIPSTGKNVRFRPFLVKEEKALLIAQQTEDTKVMIDSMKAVLDGVILDDINTDKLAIFDLEYMLLQVRAKSVGETIDLFFGCEDDHGEELNKKAVSKVQVNIDDIKVLKTEGHSNKIPLFGDVGVVMRYPTLDLTDQADDLEDIENLMSLVADLIEVIYDGDNVYEAKETPKKEMLEFLNNLTAEQFNKIQNFFMTMPKLQAHVEYNCPVCNRHYEKTLEGLSNFFS